MKGAAAISESVMKMLLLFVSIVQVLMCHVLCHGTVMMVMMRFAERGCVHAATACSLRLKQKRQWCTVSTDVIFSEHVGLQVYL